jgi:hypothetical protein
VAVDPEFRQRLDGLSEAEFHRLYGLWKNLRPADAAALLTGFDAPWWIAGGWAIDTFTGTSRPHDDLDVCVLERDVPRFVEHVLATHHVWAAGSGMLCPMLAPTQDRPDNMRQLWIRESADQPWLLDVLVTPNRGDRWAFHRDPSVVEDLERVTWVADDGITYLRPEVALASKAALARAKDVADLDVTLPLLEPDATAWLVDVLERVYPDHPWLARLR